MAAEAESARRALIGDAAEIASLATAYVAALQGARGGDALAARVRRLADADAVAKLVADTGASVVVVGLYGGVIAGFAHAILRDDAGEEKRVEVEAMYIDAPFRRVGVGEAVLGEIVRYAREEHAPSVDVVALPGDGATKSFLEATGFRARLLVMHRSSESG